MKHLKTLSFSFCVLAFSIIRGQQPNTNNSKEKPPVRIESFAYPDFQDGSRYADFKVAIALSESTEINIFGYHYRNMVAERFRIPIQVKQYIGKNLHVIGGYEQEWDIRNKFRGTPNPQPLQSIYYGMGYDVKKGLTIEATMQSIIVQPKNALGQPEFLPVGSLGGGTFLKVGSKYRF